MLQLSCHVKVVAIGQELATANGYFHEGLENNIIGEYGALSHAKLWFYSFTFFPKSVRTDLILTAVKWPITHGLKLWFYGLRFYSFTEPVWNDAFH